MAQITSFEHNGISIETSEAPAPLGPLGDNVVGIVGTAPNKSDDIALNVPFRISNMSGLAKLDTTGDELGTLYHCVKKTLEKVQVPIYVVVVEEGLTDDETTAKVIGGVDATSGQLQGISALALCKEPPTLIGAPGTSHQTPVISALRVQANRLMCRVCTDAPDGSVESLVAFSESLGGVDAGFNRVYVVGSTAAIYSKAALGNVYVPGSTLGIAAMAAVKPWESPGNQSVDIEDVLRPVAYDILDTSTDGDLLNRYGISYFAHTTLGGFSMIGNRAVDGTFISHTGLFDAISRKLRDSAQEAMAKQLTKSFMEQRVRTINLFVQDLVKDEVIPGGEVYLHPTLNTVERYKNGSWYIVIDIGRYSPNEHMIFHLNAKDSIIEEFIEDVIES